MRRKAVIIGALLGSLTLCWAFTLLDKAGVLTERTVYVETSDLHSHPGIDILDANNAFFTVTEVEPNRPEVRWAKAVIHADDPTCRTAKRNGPLVTVMGRLNDDRQYPVVIDTGCTLPMIVSDLVVLENGLEVFPIKAGPGLGGLCHVDQVEIGDITISRPPCYYASHHCERRRFGRTTWQEKRIILGLGLLRRCRYVLIDNVVSEVTFGLAGSFTPTPNESWRQFPMSIEGKNGNMLRIMVDIPIARQTRRIAMDTGAAWNLWVARPVWETLAGEVRVVKRSLSRSQMFHGFVGTERVTVAGLRVGERTLSTATIAVLDEDATDEPDLFLLGMGNFADTAITLDFEHNLLWVRNPEDGKSQQVRTSSQPNPHTRRKTRQGIAERPEESLIVGP